MIARHDFAIASSGTTSDLVHMPGYRLVGLLLPTLDSTTITFRVAHDAAATGVQTIKISGHGDTPAATNLGTADTGAKYVAVPREIGEASAVAFLGLIVASQTGGARTIPGFFMRDN